MTMLTTQRKRKPTSMHCRFGRSYWQRYWLLYLMLFLPVVYLVVFKYAPMANILIAFKKYSITKSVWEMNWAKNSGFEYFLKAFRNQDFLFALRNTISLNFLDLLIGFPAPIVLALLLNELRFKKFKRITQTVVYMPHFLSWVIISGIATRLFAPSSGMINLVLNHFKMESIPFLNDSAHWVMTYIALGIWKNAGWNAIIYLAALTSVNPELYEAAAVDGAGRLRRLWSITLPSIRPTIITLFIMTLGRILGSEFDRPYALSNNLVKDVSNVISTFVYTHGIRGLQFSLSTAVGLFQSVINVLFLVVANAIANKTSDSGIY